MASKRKVENISKIEANKLYIEGFKILIKDLKRTKYLLELAQSIISDFIIKSIPPF